MSNPVESVNGKPAQGSTGDSPDGTGETIQVDQGGRSATPQSPVPVGGSPNGAGESPALPHSHAHAEKEAESGGIAQFFVEHREVSWLALIAVLVWGGIAYTKLGQQEDPTIPQRTAMLVTLFPGATASKVEELVSKPLERKISELKSIEEIKTTSRPGISTMTIKQLPGSTATIDQQWDKVRAKIFEVQLPEGTRQPWLNTDFGNTITLLFGLVSPPITDAECVARAKSAAREARRNSRAARRRRIARRWPHSCPPLSPQYREVLTGRLETALRAAGLAKEVRTAQGHSFILADLETSASRADLEKLHRRFHAHRHRHGPRIVSSRFHAADPADGRRRSAAANPRARAAALQLSHARIARARFRGRAEAGRERRQSHQGRHRAGSRSICCFRTRISPATG